ncbi:MAG: hypothetical protein AAB930_01015 [Patescibacteria group bacterium]
MVYKITISVLLVLAIFLIASNSDAQGVTSGSGVIKLPAGGQFAKFIKWLFPAILTTAAILAVVMIIIAGFQWVTAYGNTSKIEDARDRIFNAIIGLILAFAAWLILNTINPALVNLTIFS